LRLLSVPPIDKTTSSTVRLAVHLCLHRGGVHADMVPNVAVSRVSDRAFPKSAGAFE
jgi:hypothetical protein